MRSRGGGILLSAKIRGEFSREVEERRGFFLGHVSNRRCHARLLPLPSKSELFHLALRKPLRRAAIQDRLFCLLQRHVHISHVLAKRSGKLLRYFGVR